MKEMVVSGVPGKFFSNEEIARINELILKNNELIRELKGDVEQ